MPRTKKRPVVGKNTRPSIPDVPEVRQSELFESGKPEGAVKGPRGSNIRVENRVITEVPEEWKTRWPKMTVPEAEVMRAFYRLNMKPGVDFEYQKEEFGGRTNLQLGGTIVDFIWFGQHPFLALPVNGNYWHYQRGKKVIEDDLFALRRLQSDLGYDVIILDEDDLERHGGVFVLSLALFNHRDISQLSGRL